MRSNKINKKDLFKKKTEKDEFYFYKTVATSLKTYDLLTEFIPKILSNYQWKKSMKWGEFDLNWGRPLKSILSIFDKKIVSFKFHHLTSSNLTFLDKDFEEKKRSFENFKKYEKFFEDNGVIINQNKRLKIINKSFLKILGKKELKINENPKLIDEVVNLVDSPNVLLCKFDKKFLSVPKEILTLTMESHQKYFPTFNDKNEITNEFLIVTNKKDKKGLIKIGNERVVDASTTLSLPILMRPFLSFLFVTIKNSFVISFLSLNVGKYFWWDSIVRVKISLGTDKNFLSNLHNKTFGLSTKFTTSSINLGFSLIFNSFFPNIFKKDLLIIFNLLFWLMITPLSSKNFSYFLKFSKDLFFSSKSLSKKVKLEEVKWWNLKLTIFLSNIDKIDFNGLPQFKSNSPHFIDFFHW